MIQIENVKFILESEAKIYYERYERGRMRKEKDGNRKRNIKKK